jgi:hypothetical protein
VLIRFVKEVPVSVSSLHYWFYSITVSEYFTTTPHNSPAGRSLACNTFLFICVHFFSLFVTCVLMIIEWLLNDYWMIIDGYWWILMDIDRYWWVWKNWSKIDARLMQRRCEVDVRLMQGRCEVDVRLMQGRTKIHPRYIQDTSKIHPRYIQNTTVMRKNLVRTPS